MVEFNFNRILVPVDFSPASVNALDTAIAMAKRHDAAILLLHVIETSALLGFPGDGSVYGETVQALTEKSEQELQCLQHSIKERSMVPCEAITMTGVVCSSIIKICACHQADLIVMGTHGVSGFKELIMGSNAFSVIKNSNFPVLTIPPEKKWESFRRILFPVRPIPYALEKYDFVRKIIRKNKATIKILGLATDFEQEVDLLRDLAWQLNEKLREDEVPASTYFKVGNDMAEEVLKIATVMAADLIVITANIDLLLNQLFVGPYAHQIINHARFPVLSLKPSRANDHAKEVVQDTLASFPPLMPHYN